MKLSDKIKICRQNNHLTQEQFAKKLNVSRKTVSGWENNRSFPDISTLIQLSDTFNISLDLLLKNSDRAIDYYQYQLTSNKNNHRAVTFVYFALMISCIFSYLKLFNLLPPTHYLTSIFLIFFLITYILIYPRKYKVISIHKIIFGLLFLLSIFLINAIIFVSIDKKSFVANDPSYFMGNIVGITIISLLISMVICVLIFCIPESISNYFKRHNDSITDG